MSQSIVTTTSQMTALQTLLWAEDVIAIDTETNYTSNSSDRFLVGISIAFGNDSVYIPIGHTDSLFGTENYFGEPFTTLLGNYKGIVVMHNAKFDLAMLDGYINIPTDRLMDTMLMSYLIDEEPPHGLKELAKIRLDWEEPKKLQAGIKKAGSYFGYEAIPASVMSLYACQDAEMTLQLYYDLLEDFEEYESLWPREREFMLLLLKMEQHGLPIDLDSAALVKVGLTSRLNALQQTLGFDPAKSSVLARKLFGVPPEGLGLKPLNYTPSGKPDTSEAVLEKYGHPTTALVVEYRTTAKQLSSYIMPYMALAAETGRLRPTFKQHGTLTGRLSCEAPNLQQIPRESPIKKLFLAERDCQLWEFDYKNIEMRLKSSVMRGTCMVQLPKNLESPGTQRRQ
jgi:DNA polymerase I